MRKVFLHLMIWLAHRRVLQEQAIIHENVEAFPVALLQEMLPIGKEANCWLAQNAMPATPYGQVGTPNGATVTVHQLVVVDTDVWTISLDVWSRGGDS